MNLLIRDTLRRLDLVEYPKGHPQGPWEASISYADEDRWFRGWGKSPQEAIDSAKDMGARPPVTYSQESKAKVKAEAQSLLDLLGL